MPRKSTIPLGLKQLLKLLKTCVLRLSRETKIPSARLVEIYETGDITQAELHDLLRALGSPLVDYLAAALGRMCADRMVTGMQMQIGVVNQTGYGNKQRTKLENHHHHHQHIHLHVMNEPEPRALGASPQRQQLQPGHAGGVVRQLGPVGAGQDVEKAA
ncbi:hypothetical protein GCM10027594_07820 [Hymenobacter agri]